MQSEVCVTPLLMISVLWHDPINGKSLFRSEKIAKRQRKLAKKLWPIYLFVCALFRLFRFKDNPVVLSAFLGKKNLLRGFKGSVTDASQHTLKVSRLSQALRDRGREGHSIVSLRLFLAKMKVYVTWSFLFFSSKKFNFVLEVWLDKIEELFADLLLHTCT